MNIFGNSYVARQKQNGSHTFLKLCLGGSVAPDFYLLNLFEWLETKIEMY